MKKITIIILIITVIIAGYYYLNSSSNIGDVVKVNSQEKVEQFNENILVDTEESILSEIDLLESEEDEIDEMISELEELSF